MKSGILLFCLFAKATSLTCYQCPKVLLQNDNNGSNILKSQNVDFARLSQWVVFDIVQAKVMVEIFHKWIVSKFCKTLYAMNNELSVPGEGGKLKLQRRRRPIWVVQRRALVSEVLEQSERCEVSNQLRHPAQFFSSCFLGLCGRTAHWGLWELYHWREVEKQHF